MVSMALFSSNQNKDDEWLNFLFLLVLLVEEEAIKTTFWCLTDAMPWKSFIPSATDLFIPQHPDEQVVHTPVNGFQQSM